jgi:hypothetical protein
MPAAKTLQLRFKLPEISVNTPLSQSLLINRTGSTNTSTQFALVLEYTGSLTSGSYSGSAVDPYYQYGTLKFILAGQSASVYLPFYDGGWWSVMVNQVQGNDLYYTYSLYAKNKLYNGDDGNIIGFQASSSLVTYTGWNQTATIQIPGSGSATLSGKTYLPATASFQEVRYYTTALSESVFNDYVMNANSIEGNSSSYNELFFRASLGGELYTGSTSIHPSVTGSSPTASFVNGTSNFSFTSSYNFISNTEVNFYDQPAVGIKNAVSNKIKQSSTILPLSSSLDENIPSNTTLSPFISIQQNPSISSSYTRDVDYLEVAFSPQNEINEDIMDSFGYFNIGEYIGDPRQISSPSTSYPDLDTLRNEYFKKYTHNYNVWDYIRLIKYFDNSLFKMIKDWTPARTSLASGIVLKQHILERNKYPVPQMSFSQPEYTGSIDMYTYTGSDGGGLNITSIVTQSWAGAHTSISGSIPFTQNNESEFFDGQFSGSFIEVTNGELNDCNSQLRTVYTTASLFSNINPNSPGGFFNNYNINYDKVYYISFTITEVNNVESGTLQLWNGGLSNKVLYTSPTISAGGSLTVSNLEISKVILPITFKSIGGSGFGLSITNLSISELYFEPDCLPIEGTVLDNRLNSFYMDVDYSNNNLIPVNQQLILSGSATRFPVPDSYYTSLRHITPRYLGSKYSGNYNLSSSYAPGSTPTGFPIDNFVNWFVYFDYIESSFPEVPGGGNIHCTYLVNTEGQAIPLTNDNRYLQDISNIFKPGIKANILPAVYSGKQTPQVTIFDGGTKYTSIAIKSGSVNGISFQVDFSTPISVTIPLQYSASFTREGSTVNIITDSGSYNEGWLSFMYTSSEQGLITTYDGFNFYRKDNGGYLSQGIYSDTLLPLKKHDFIRVSTTSYDVDENFNQLGLYRIMDFVPGNFISGSLYILPTLNDYKDIIFGSPGLNSQNYRIFRRIPNETFIVSTTLPPYTDPGFLIPENFNPAYDPYDLAKKAGLIT